MHLIYKTFIKPSLLQEQQQQRAVMVQLQQKLSSTQTLMKVFKDQVNYLTTLFKKISQQQKQAQELIKNSEHEHAITQVRIQADYQEQQKVITHTRNLQQLYNTVAPEVIVQLRAELQAYAQDNGKQYLTNAIKALRKVSERKSNA
jgi:hypothetical protein